MAQQKKMLKISKKKALLRAQKDEWDQAYILQMISKPHIKSLLIEQNNKERNQKSSNLTSLITIFKVDCIRNGIKLQRVLLVNLFVNNLQL